MPPTNVLTRFLASKLMHLRPTFCGRYFLAVMAFAATFGYAPRSVATADDIKVETVLSGLRAPCGLAVRPDSEGTPYEVFVADRGAGRIVQISSATPGTGSDAISGFAVDEATTDASSSASGLHAIFFLDHTRLVVTGGDENSKPFLRLYDLSDSDTALKAEDHKQDVELPRIVNDSTVSVLRFYNLARTQPNDRVADTIVVAAAGERESAGLWKVAVRANTLGDSAQFDVADDSDALGAIGGIAVGSEGYIVVACGRESGSLQPNTLKYLSPINGHIVLDIETKLQRIAALAYSPKTGSLYAANSAPVDKGGGVYRIDDASEPGKPACVAVKIAKAARPTALAFGPDGMLYVTVLGQASDGGNDAGALLKLTGDL